MGDCISKPQHGKHCHFAICFDYVAAFGSLTNGSFIKIGHLLSVLILWSITIWNVFIFSKQRRISWMRILNTLFAFLTGIFGLARYYYELGKPLAITAALHNLCEWGFVCYAMYPNKTQRKQGFLVCSMWIILVILLIIIIKEFPGYLLVEQISGIAMDFLLTFIWFMLLKQNNIFVKPFYAHSVHLVFTILPLVTLNFIQNQNDTISILLETSIYISVPITHILYTQFTSHHETYIAFSSYYPQNVIMDYPKSIKSIHLKILFMYLLSVFIGLFPTFIIPKYILMRNDGKFCDECSVDDSVFGTAVYHIYNGMEKAFEYHIQSNNLLTVASNYEGNKLYYFTKNIFENNSYVFIEHWESIQFAYKWINSDIVDKTFHNDYAQSMMKGGKVAKVSGYQSLNLCNTNNNGVGTVRYIFSKWNGCVDIWNDIIDFTECKWILNCNHIQIINELKGERLLFLNNGLQLHYKRIDETVIKSDEKMTRYNYLLSIEELHRSSQIQLIFNEEVYGRDKCVGIFTYHTDLKIASVQQIYHSFIEKNIPFLQNRYQRY